MQATQRLSFEAWLDEPTDDSGYASGQGTVVELRRQYASVSTPVLRLKGETPVSIS
jgi:hypothetical protein